MLTRSNGFSPQTKDSNFLQTLQTMRIATYDPKRPMTTTHSAKQSMSMDNLFRGTQTPLTVNDIKPKLLEQRVTEHDTFFRLSDGFKKIFVNDKKDQKMVIPIVGYGGHRRGDRS